MKATSLSEDIGARLAVIENKLETIIEEIAAVREYIPVKMVEHAEHIMVLERNMRTMQWVAGVFATAAIGTFISQVIGGR